KDRQILRLNFLSATDLRNSDLTALFLHGSQRYLFAPQDRAQSFAIIRDAFADNDLVQSVAAFENIRRHGCKLQSGLSVLHVWSGTNRSGLSVRTRMLLLTICRVQARTTIDQLAQFVYVGRALHGGV